MPLRIVFWTAFMLILLDYVFIATLCPEAGSGPSDASDVEGKAADNNREPSDDEESGSRFSRDQGINGIERLASRSG